MKYRKTHFVIIFCMQFMFFLPLFSQEKELTSEQFLNIVRTPRKEKTWAMLKGKARNMKKNKEGKKITESPIYLGVRFTSIMIFAQVVIDKNEIYKVGQPYSLEENSASVMKEGDKKADSLKADFGIRPEDLTMSFIFWDLIRELEKDTAHGQACRVFLLKSPDKKEMAKVYISSEYYFPLKVEWSKYKKDKDFGEVIRSLEAKSFEKIKDIYIVNPIIFTGPGWKTEVAFSDCKAGYVKDGTPKDLFKAESAK